MICPVLYVCVAFVLPACFLFGTFRELDVFLFFVLPCSVLHVGFVVVCVCLCWPVFVAFVSNCVLLFVMALFGRSSFVDNVSPSVVFCSVCCYCLVFVRL